MKNVLFIFAIVLMAACSNKKDQDTIPPTISDARVNGIEDEIRTHADSTVVLTARVNDDRDLGQFKIDIHDDFDGHDHGRIMAKWAEVILLDISGTEALVNQDIHVPADAFAGPYHMVLRALDASGNESEFVRLTLLVSNGSEPVITVQDPDLSQTPVIMKGSTLSLKGSITDDTDLAEIRVLLRSGKEIDPAVTITDADFDLPGSNDTSWDMQSDGNLNISIPTNISSGMYELLILAKDDKGNIGILESDILIQ